MVCDLGIITAFVYETGVQDSYFLSLYLLAILMGSILFSRRGAFLVAGASFILLGCTAESMYAGMIPLTMSSMPDIRFLELWLASNLFAFLSIAYLGSLLSQSVRRKGIELEEKQEEIKDLQAFNHDIIESMRGGLLTTDMDGGILLLNRAAVEIMGMARGTHHGEKIQNLFPSFWPVETDEQGWPLALRRELEIKTPSGATRFLGLSISPLRTGQNQTTGYVFNFQDLTELRRLEREVVTKERMAALGRLSAAIAHEIRQPLTAMTGALKELARLAPLEEDDKKLVQIVSRESQRLNKIITDFLDYSREKAYGFAEVDLVPLVEENLLLLERDASVARQYKIVRNFSVRHLRVKADRDAMKQVLWNLCNNALRAMKDGGALSVGLEAEGNWARISVRDTGIGLDTRETNRIFEPFQSGFTGGTGLGLAIVYQILQAHGGHIRVESGKGLGAAFIFEIPLAAQTRTSTREASHAGSGMQRAVGKG